MAYWNTTKSCGKYNSNGRLSYRIGELAFVGRASLIPSKAVVSLASNLDHHRSIRPSLTISFTLLFGIVLDAACIRTFAMIGLSQTDRAFFSGFIIGFSGKVLLFGCENLSKRRYLIDRTQAKVCQSERALYCLTLLWVGFNFRCLLRSDI